MTAVVSLPAMLRDKSGKGAARALRREGQVPAIIYGPGKPEQKIAIPLRDIAHQFAKPSFYSQLVDLNAANGVIRVLPRAVQLHPVTDIIEHVDFIYVSKDSKVRVAVKIHLLNEDKCIGIKRGGLLNLVVRDIEVECHPDVIPASFDIDITNLNIANSIHVHDISFPEGVTPIDRRNYTVLTLTGRASDESDEKKAG
jgi:large subunit ribosomal protein L25